MAQYRIPIIYAPGGLDFKMPSTLRSPNKARDGLNFDITSSLDLVKRAGYHMRSINDDVGYGITLHENRESVTQAATGFGAFAFGTDPFGSPTNLGLGDIEPVLVGIDSNPKKWIQGSLDITYSGTASAAVTVRAESGGEIEIVLLEDGAETVSITLGDGTEASPYSISSLASAISIFSGFSASVTGTGTGPAAFLDLRNSYALTKDTPHSIDFGYWETINSPYTTPQEEMIGRIGRDDFENPTTTNLNSILYIQNGFDPMLKYDGQNLYNVGLPRPSAPTLNVDTGTSAPAGMSGVYKYRVQYRQIDNMQLIYEGRVSEDSATADNSAGPYEIEVTVTNIAADSGYNTNGAITVGAHSSTNVSPGQERINVDDGAGGDHTLQVGDTAYFYDNASSAYVTALVTARTSSTVTLEASSTLTVSDNMPISNNLRIEIWRTDAGGSTFSLVEEIPNNSFNSTQVYSDVTADADLGASFSTPIKTPGTPTACKYVTTWRNQVIMAGDPFNPGRVYYSEFDGTTLAAENYPATNFFDIAIGSRGSASITGIGVLGEDLIIFTENRAFWASGNLSNDDITVNEISDNIGCVAHATIASMDNGLFFLSRQGVYRISPSTQRSNYFVDKISDDIDPVFTRGANNEYFRHMKRAQAVVWPSAFKYLLYLPTAELKSGEWYSTSESVVFAYDMRSGEWYKWDNIHALGGMLVWDDDTEESDSVVWFSARVLDSGSLQESIHKFNHTDSEIDFADHTAAITMEYCPQWEFGSAPRVQKLYNEIVIDAFRTSSDLAYTPTGQLTIEVSSDFNQGSTDVSFTADYLSDDKEIVKALPRRLRRAIGLKFKNSELNKQMLISGWSIEGFSLNNNIRR